MSDKEVKKCNKESGFCEIMQDRVESSGTSGKGLKTLTVMNGKTGKMSVDGIFYKTSAKDNGLMLNNCPWCGESLEWFK